MGPVKGKLEMDRVALEHAKMENNFHPQVLAGKPKEGNH